MKKILKVNLILVVLFSVIFLFTACNSGEEIGKFDRSGIEILSGEEAVEAGELTWTLLESEYLGSLIVDDENEGSLETKEGRFLALRFNVINNSDEPRSIFDLRIIDSNGNQYSVCIEAYGYIGTEEACVLEELLPGIERTFTATYDVPLDAVDLIMEVTDLKYPPDNMAYIDLGL